MKCKRFAITGGIACGKSTVSKILPDYGGIVLDTDDVAHDLEAPGGEAVPEIVRSFGDCVLSDDGSINRRVLGQIVFSNSEALSRLNSIVHPLVVRKVSAWLDLQSKARFKAVVIPLLFESGFDTIFQWDGVFAIVCSEKEQLRRLYGRGLDDKAARARIASQLPCALKAKKADWAIWNDSDLSTLRLEVEKALRAFSI